jgi:uncharacterized membrane protein YgdD (TMEM256/DUF423 family)
MGVAPKILVLCGLAAGWARQEYLTRWAVEILVCGDVVFCGSFVVSLWCVVDG